MASFHSFYGSVVCHCVYAPHLLYPLGNGYLGCLHILGILTSSALPFELKAFSQDMSRSGIAGLWGSLILEEPSSGFPYWVHQFTFPPTVFKYFFFSSSLPAFICVLLDDAYFGRCEGVNSVGVDLHFFDDYRCKASFPVPVCHLYIFFGKKCLLRPLALFKMKFFFCLLCSCMNSLCISDISPLQNIWIANIFSYFISFHFSLFYFVDLCYNSSSYYLLFFCV